MSRLSSFCTPVSPACRHQVEAEDLGKVGVHGREPGQPVKRSGKFSHRRQLVRREPGRTDSRSAVSQDGETLCASTSPSILWWTSATLADSISSVFDTFCYFSWPTNLGRVLVGCVLELELVNKGHCVLTAEWVPTAHLHCGSCSDLIHLEQTAAGIQ